MNSIETPLVSVIIPAFDAGATLAACLASVSAQGEGVRHEIIVIDDGSTDDTLEIARATPGVTGISQNNRGPAAARNAGIERARGEYLAFLDADDLWPKGKLAHQLALLQDHSDAALCFGDCRQFGESETWTRTLFESGQYGASAWGDGPYVPDAYARLLRDNFITTGSVMARRGVIQALGGFDESLRLVEDLELWLRVARHHPIAWTERVCLLRRRHAANTSREAAAMSLAYLQVLARQPRDAADLDALVAREYQDMAGRALTDRRGGDAMRWAWRSLAARPSVRALWYLAVGTGQRLVAGRGPQ